MVFYPAVAHTPAQRRTGGRPLKSLQWTVTVDRPQAEVFAYLADIAKHGDWSPKPWRMEGTEGPLTLGTKFTSYGHIPGDKQHRNDVECTTFEPPNKIELTTQEDNGIFVTAYVLTSEGSGRRWKRPWMSRPRRGSRVSSSRS
jgi:uncharacterized protein YndB with AHSA1/START domain